MAPAELPADLARLAEAHGVATCYLDADDVEQVPPASTVRACLQAMDVPCGDDAEILASLQAAELDPWRRMVPPTAVVREGGPRTVALRLPADGAVELELLPEGGGDPVALQVHRDRPGPTVDGIARAHGTAEVPPGIAAGVHRLRVRGGETTGSGHLLVVPARCPLPEDRRRWGWQVQLYAMRSLRSWGIGDLADLTTLVREAGVVHGADFVLLNPLHAVAPVVPQEASPYYPSSRRAWNPLYLRPERCDGWDAASGTDRDRLDALQQAGLALNGTALIDRDAVFTAKDEALRICAAQPSPTERGEAFDRYVAEGGEPLARLATAFAITRQHGATVAEWPEPLRGPNGPAVTAAGAELEAEITYQLWLQWQADEQLAAAQQTAGASGMDLGLLTDLAVGVDAQGADGWALADTLARDVTVGAPPDALAQRGQDWRLPPLRPDRLAATGYRAFRELIGVNLRHAGGLRIDHVMGLFRLFWIPEGADATDGTYVRYDAEAMLGALALEATRAGGIVIGEDLGTVEEGVREALADRGILGSAVFWFEQPHPTDDPGGDETDDETEDADDGRPARAAEYRRLALTSVTTHDLPTVAGWAADEPTRIRAATDQLATTEEAERARTAARSQALADLLVAEGVLADADRGGTAALIDAVHAFVARTPSLLVSASLADAVGDLRQPNLPGTDETVYPSWRLPIATPDPGGTAVAGLLPASRPVPLEELLEDPRVADLAHVLSEGRRATG